MKADVIIRDARIVDGTGAPWYYGEVVIEGSRIVGVGFPGQFPRQAARVEIDAGKNIVCPGFIDIHSHSDFLLKRDPLNLSKVQQGVTTEVVGQCGLSPAPVNEQYKDLLKYYTNFLHAGAELDWNWQRLGEYYASLEQDGLGLNVAYCAGHGTIRLAVMGFENRKATSQELKKMRHLAQQTMEDGAVGISSGLIYPPGAYSDLEELVDICRAIAPYGGIYFTHIRNESKGFAEAVREAIAVGARSGVPVQISHFKAIGKENWERLEEVFEIIEKARLEGIDVTLDQYPYSATSTTLCAILPPWCQEGGIDALCSRLEDEQERRKIRYSIEHETDWDNQVKLSGSYDGILIIYAPATPEVQGMTLEKAATKMGADPLDLAFDIIKANRGAANACYSTICEENVKAVMKNPLVMIGSDGIPVPPSGQPHPRMNGTFPRVLGHYARNEKLLPIEEAIRKMTSLPTSRLGLSRKGQIGVGKDADIVIFNEDKIVDRAVYGNATVPPEGIEYVFVNGELVLREGQHTGKRPGTLLKKY